MSDLASPPAADAAALDLLAAVAVPAAVWRDGCLLAANEALARLTRRAPTELCGLSLDALVLPDDRESLARSAADALAGTTLPPAVAVRLTTPEGGERPVELHARPYAWGDRPAVLLTCIDQSDIQHVQTSLFALSGLLGQIVDGAPLATLVIDQAHRVTHWNAACERLTGVARVAIVGRREAWRAVHRAPRPMLADLVLDGIDGGDAAALAAAYDGPVRASRAVPGGLEVEAWFPHFGEAGAWLYATAAPLRDAEGRVVGAIETLQDVSRRHRIEDELRRHRLELEELVRQRSAELAATAQELEQFIEEAPIGVAWSCGGVLQRVNPAIVAMLGERKGGWRGAPLDELGLPAGLVARVSALPGGADGLHEEAWLHRSGGGEIWVQVDARAARGPAGEGLWWMMQDRSEIRAAHEVLHSRVDELRETNRRLEEAQNQLLQQDKMAMIGQLAAGVAHEINNPVGFVGSNLNSLRRYADDLLRLTEHYDAALAAPGDAATAQALAAQREAVELDYLREDLPVLLDECAEGLGRVRKIVQDLKDFSRVDQSDWQEADLNAGLESTLNVVRHEVKYKARVVRRLGELPPVRCLAAQLNQVFMNLVVNASQALGDQGTITLSSGTDGDWAWVQIDDDGRGMDEAVQRRVFEPFFTTKEVGKGTGLGLSLSFSIVRKHGGAIQLRSAVGVGSSFRVWVPIGGPGTVPETSVPTGWLDGPWPMPSETSPPEALLGYHAPADMHKTVRS
jgi:PAS domain S-box-containing protein